jgi:oligopeptide/dipeptide ABC transporter ATP-binding protein
VVEYISDRVGVMYLGRIVELAPATALFADPQMPYTQALLSAIPDRGEGERQRIVLTGDVPSPINPPSGCPFRTRCWRAQDRCASEVPQLREVRPDHWAACHFPGKDETELSVRVHDCNWMMIEEYLIRGLTVDGSFGGPHERPDEEMLEIWRAGVEEVRDLVENGWAVK